MGIFQIQSDLKKTKKKQNTTCDVLRNLEILNIYTQHDIWVTDIMWS